MRVSRRARESRNGGAAGSSSSTELCSSITDHRSLLEGIEIPSIDLESLNANELFPVELGIGSDGSLYISLPAFDLSLDRVPRGSRVFVGVAKREHASIAGGLREFLKARSFPCVLGLNGSVFYACTSRRGVLRALKRGKPMFYGFSASRRQARHIQEELDSAACNALFSLPAYRKPKAH